jgi:hypothetical protein
MKPTLDIKSQLKRRNSHPEDSTKRIEVVKTDQEAVKEAAEAEVVQEEIAVEDLQEDITMSHQPEKLESKEKIEDLIEVIEMRDNKMIDTITEETIEVEIEMNPDNTVEEVAQDSEVRLEMISTYQEEAAEVVSISTDQEISEVE